MAEFDPSRSGTHIHNRKLVCPGYRLYDGQLIDIDGKEMRQWEYGYLSTFMDGLYLAQKGYEQKGWGMFSLDGKKKWGKNDAIHHDIQITKKNTIITFTKECHDYKNRKVDFDVIMEYNKKGKLINRFSLWENLEAFQQHHKKLELDLQKRWFLPELVPKKPTTPWGGNYDYYRLNSINILPKTPHKDKRFQEGNWLLTFRHGSMLFILDEDTKNIAWKAISKDIPSAIEGPHGAQMLPNGNILLFDNGRYRKQSRVIEFDPINLNIVWEYTHDGMFSLSQGYAQRLPNGNTLITESERGHAFEVTPKKKIVWEFYHPAQQSKDNQPLHPESWGERQWIYRMTWWPSETIEQSSKKKN